MNTDNCFEYSFAALGTDRDAPLTFAWRTAQSEMAALGLRPAHNWRHEDARNAVFSEAVLADSHGRAPPLTPDARPITLAGSGITGHRMVTRRPWPR